MFCKSNRRTALRWSSSTPSTAAAISLRVSPLSLLPLGPRGPSRLSLLRPRATSVGAAAILFLKNDRQAHFRSFVHSRCKRGVRFSSAYSGAMANASNRARGRKRNEEEKKKKMERKRDREANSFAAMLESHENTALPQAPGNPIHPRNSSIIVIGEIGGLMTRLRIG